MVCGRRQGPLNLGRYEIYPRKEKVHYLRFIDRPEDFGEWVIVAQEGEPLTEDLLGRLR